MTDSLMIQKITSISTTCLSPEPEYGSELELELLPVSKETLDTEGSEFTPFQASHHI